MISVSVAGDKNGRFLMEQTVKWLLEGDVSQQFLTHSLLPAGNPALCNSLQPRIETEGYGAKLLSCQNESGHWGLWFYQPKWTCTHYTLAEMKDIGMPPGTRACREMVFRAFNECMLENGGINFAKTMIQSDVAVDGMILNYASYFCPEESRLARLAGYILSQAKPDGGYSWTRGLKVTLTRPFVFWKGFMNSEKPVLLNTDEIRNSENRAVEYLLSNGLFMNDDNMTNAF